MTPTLLAAGIAVGIVLTWALAKLLAPTTDKPGQ